MEKKTNYKCGLCGKEYETIAERAKCEMACIDKQVAIEEKAKKEKNKKEQEARRQEVVAAINQANEATSHASELLSAYVDKYGSFSYSSAEDTPTETAAEPTVKPVAKTTSKTETTSKDAWPFDSWPFTSKLFHYFW